MKYGWLFTPIIWWLVSYVIFDFEGLYGQDSHEYFRYSKSLKHSILSFSKPSAFFWPLIYPLTISAISLLTQNVLITAQLISLCSFIGVLFFLNRILKFHPYKNRGWLLLIFATTPYLLKSSIVVMGDILAIFFISGALFHFLQQQNGKKHFVLFAVYSFLALNTRYQSALLLFIPSIVMLYEIMRHKYWVTLLFISGIVLLMSIPIFYIQNSPLEHYGLKSWNIHHFFSSEFSNQDGVLKFRFWNIVFTSSLIIWPGLFLIGLPSLLFIKKTDIKRYWPVHLSILIYILFMSGVPFQNTRHFLLLFPFFILAFLPAINRLNLKVNKRSWIFIIVILIQLIGAFHTTLPIYQNSAKQKQITSFIQSHYQNLPIYSFGWKGALSSYKVNNSYHSIYDSLYVRYEKPSIWLINKNLIPSFKGLNPSKNWQQVQKTQKLTQVKQWDDTWVLYTAD